MTIVPAQNSWLRKRGVLLLLFFAYLLTSSIVIEQQHTIDSQRALIRDLFHDSMELTQMKMKEVRRQPAAKP